MSLSSRGIVFSGVGQPLSLQQFPTPITPRAGYLVRVTACTLCGSDLHSIDGRRKVPVPSILGHEILGLIESIGDNDDPRDATGLPLSVGDRVTWSIVASCGQCYYCHRGIPQKCEHQTKYGHEAIRPGLELTGGLADHVLLVPGTAIFRIPDNVLDAVACPANCATATVAAAFDAAGEVVGRDLLILGAGMLGVTAAAWALKAGARSIVVCDREPSRLDLARTLGATAVCSPTELAQTVAETTQGRGIDAALELTGAAESVESALALARIGGTIVLVGSVFPTRAVSLLPEQVVRRCLTIRGVHNYAPWHLEAALNFLAGVDQSLFASLVGEWRPLASLEGLTTVPPPTSGLRLGIRPGM